MKGKYMCGICGIVNFNVTKPVDRYRVERMTSAQAHRGPDDHGDVGRHSPFFFKAAATSGGMYFSSCLASTLLAVKLPSAERLPSTTTPWPSRKRSGRTPRLNNPSIL